MSGLGSSVGVAGHGPVGRAGGRRRARRPGRLPRLVFGAATAGLLLSPVAAGAAAATASSAAPNGPTGVKPVVEAARQVTTSTNPTRLFTDPQVAVDPQNPNTVVVAVGDFRNGGCGLYASKDGGLAFVQEAANVLPPSLKYCSDLYNNSAYIAPAFAPDGTLYVALNGTSLAAGYPQGAETPLVVRSKDLGLTRQTSVIATPQPVKVGAKSVMQDYHSASLAVDPTNSHRVYVGWELRTTTPPGAGRSFHSPPVQTEVAVSNDGGATWGRPIDVTRVATGLSLYGSGAPYIVVSPDGTVHAFAEESPKFSRNGPKPVDRFLEFTSADHGAHWSASVVPNDAGSAFVDPPVAAVSPTTGELYVAWNQDGATRAVKSTIYIADSTDGGRTWSAPHDLVDPAAHARSDAYTPGISVAPDGRVDVAWYDFRNDPSNTTSIFAGGMSAAPSNTIERYFDVYGSSSSDWGKTWSADYRISDRSIDDIYGATFYDRLFGPMGMASTNDALYVTWADDRASKDIGAIEDAYLTRVEMNPAALLTSSTSGSTGGDAMWAGIGAGGILVLVGLGLLGAAASRRGSTRRGAGAGRGAGVGPGVAGTGTT